MFIRIINARMINIFSLISDRHKVTEPAFHLPAAVLRNAYHAYKEPQPLIKPKK